MRRSTVFTTLLSLCLLAPVGCAIDGDDEKVAETEGELSSRVCQQDAMQCPDGSWVGRTGPNCKFAPCPPEPPVTVCQQDAMLCPDGSWVGRTGPECKFVCPPDPTPICPQDAMLCPDGSWVGRTGPECKFVCPPDPPPPPSGPECGPNQCAAGEVCCNSLAGICTKPGEFCIF